MQAICSQIFSNVLYSSGSTNPTLHILQKVLYLAAEGSALIDVYNISVVATIKRRELSTQSVVLVNYLLKFPADIPDEAQTAVRQYNATKRNIIDAVNSGLFTTLIRKVAKEQNTLELLNASSTVVPIIGALKMSDTNPGHPIDASSSGSLSSLSIPQSVIIAAVVSFVATVVIISVLVTLFLRQREHFKRSRSIDSDTVVSFDREYSSRIDSLERQTTNPMSFPRESSREMRNTSNPTFKEGINPLARYTTSRFYKDDFVRQNLL